MVLYHSTDFASVPGAILVWRTVDVDPYSGAHIALAGPSSTDPQSSGQTTVRCGSGMERSGLKRTPARQSQTWAIRRAARSAHEPIGEA